MQTLNLSNRFLWATSRGNKPWQQTCGLNHMITMTMIFTKLSGHMTALFGGFFTSGTSIPNSVTQYNSLLHGVTYRGFFVAALFLHFSCLTSGIRNSNHTKRKKNVQKYCLSTSKTKTVQLEESQVKEGYHRAFCPIFIEVL